MAPPINDDVANATDVLVGVLKETVAGTTIDSTIEAGYEGDPFNIGSGQSVWYHFVPDDDARFALKLTKTAGGDAGWFPYSDLWRCSTYPPSDANDLVYESTSSGDGTADPPYDHELKVTAGTHYLIQVTDWDYDGSTEGNFDLDVQLVPGLLYESWEDGSIDPIVWERRIASASPGDPNTGVWTVEAVDPNLGTYSILLTPTTQTQQLHHHDTAEGGDSNRDYWVAFKFKVDWAEVWASDSQVAFLPSLTNGNNTSWPHGSTGIIADLTAFFSPSSYLWADSSSTGYYFDFEGNTHYLDDSEVHELRIRYRRTSPGNRMFVDTILDGVTIVNNFDYSPFTGSITGVSWVSTFNGGTSGSVRIDPLVWSPDTDPGPLVEGAVIEPDFISATTVYAPTLDASSAVDLDVPFISSTTTVFAASLTGDQDLPVPFIPSDTDVFAPNVLAANPMRVTQVPVEAAVAGESNLRVTQAPVEAAVRGDSDLRTTQVPVEAAVRGDSDMIATQVPVEVATQVIREYTEIFLVELQVQEP